MTAAVVLAGGGAGGAVLAAAKSVKTRHAKIGANHLVQIQVLSTRADLVSGGEALTQIILPPGAKASKAQITLGSRNVTRAFAVRPNGKFEGLVTGLALGRNVLTARLPDGYGARLTITNHPIGGPVFSGPADPAVALPDRRTDKQCDQPPTFAYYYLPAGTAGAAPDAAGVGRRARSTPMTPATPRRRRHRHDHDHRRCDGAVHHPPGDRLPRPRPVHGRRALAARQAVAAVGTPAAVQPRLVIIHGASCDTTYGTGLGAGRPGPEPARRRVLAMSTRARQRRPQLQPHSPRPSRWMMTKE